MKSNSPIITCDLGYISPWQARFFALALFLGIIIYRIVFYNSIVDYLIDTFTSPLVLICIFINAIIVSYKAGFQYNTSTNEIRKYYQTLGMKSGSFAPVKKYDSLYISLDEPSQVNTPGGNSSISISKYQLEGLINNRKYHIYSNYEIKYCLDVAFFYRKIGFDIPIIELRGREEYEY